MATTEVSATIQIENIDIAIEKMSQLKALLEEVHILISSLSLKDLSET